MSLFIILSGMKVWQGIVGMVVCLLIGAVIGFFVSRVVFKRYLKKNPPINEAQIRAMFKQMGRTPSEKQVRAVMKSYEQNK